jgi:hypothetical protein
MGGDKHIAEMAHIIPHGENGPRNDEKPSEGFEVETFDNFLLLCPTCHTIIDKDSDAYPRATLLSWKEHHLANLAHNQGAMSYSTRSQAREAVLTAMAENKAIWKELAPFDGASFSLDPESEVAKTWSHRMRSVILPNHFRIQEIIKLNQHHITEDEREFFSRYQEHVRSLSERHICGVSGSSIQFPAAMDEIFS